ncbi:MULTISPECIES: GntR family transcriptional regulator [Oceanobacillus]|uniref:GntR family transcriptional regulator n=1 Tax=Oceanobacillus indicireducens TaxID=1004261 RepID=A0A917XX37_9BACI|nr:GntR family transcriptional regulator [Oceanobacillus indicireducens]GGN55486.1 GntR family transcriptional regulator [Oceanobacillus indicireducens]
MKITFNKRDPVYVQVVQHFKEQIVSGKYELGQEIPSRRELANQLKINPNTAQRAYKEMEEAGLIFTEGNNPSRITKDEQVLRDLRTELIEGAVDRLIAAVEPVNIPIDELIGLIQEKYEEQRRGQV